MRHWWALVLAVTVPVIGFNCSQFSAHTAGTGSDSFSSTSSGQETLPIAFMSFDQMLKAMIAATGGEGLGDLSDPADAAIAAEYNNRQGSLPSNQNIVSATGPTLIAVTNIASTVCAKAVDRDREASVENRLFFVETNFMAGLNAQVPASVTESFKRLARNAWRREVTAEELDFARTFAQEFQSASANAADAAQTRLLSIGLCTAALSSIDGLTY